MMVAIPSPHWSIFRSMNAQQLADVLQELAAHVNLRRYKKHPRGPKKQPTPLSLFRFMCYTVPPRTGGTHYGRFTVCRCAVSPDGVAGFHQPDARGVSDLDPTL